VKLERDAAPGIHRIEDAFTNWYLVEGDDGSIGIVDAGVRSSWGSLQEALRQLRWDPKRIVSLVLTHAHFDHIGFAERARRRLGIPVWVHTDDVPLTKHPMQYAHETSRLPYLLRPRSAPIVASLARSGAFWPEPIETVHRFSADDAPLHLVGDPVIVPCPGHTIGHCALHFPDRDALIAGDAIVTLDPYTGRTGPRLVAGAATADSERNLEALDALAATGAGNVLTGHGPVWRRGAESAVREAQAAGSA
jgi:glyoxylase-like metal-dependent hydrolase (beta-lactamase superfamily II)